MTAYQHWEKNIDENRILWLSLDRKDHSVNSLNREVIYELDHILDEICQNDSLVGVVIRSGKSSGFIAGADVDQFTKLKDEAEAFDLVRQAQLVFDKLAALKIPTVAMIDGFCLGGGLELALACRYRVACDDIKTKLGAPEVKLGLHPGWGGTVRLPRLIGVLSAMDLNLSGRPVSAKAAVIMGLVDAAVPTRDFVRATIYYILHRPPKHRPPVWQNILTYQYIRPLVGKMLYKKLAKKVNKKHYPAPYAIVKYWVKNGAMGEVAMIDEAKSIAALFFTETSRNLVRVFSLQTYLKGLAKDVHFNPAHVCVIGAGTMGGDIAAWCVLQGFKVTLQDQFPELIAAAVKRAYQLFEKKLKLPRLVQAAMDRFIPDIQGHGISEADIVIEAISENLSIKKALYKSIEPRLKPGAFLATNTSSLSLEELGKSLKDPSRLVGMHFFNPVAMMQLVEVVHVPETDTDVLKKAMAFVKALNRLPLPVKNSPGFLVNRVLMAYLSEALILLEEGVPASTIDKAAVDFGMPMGPIALIDSVGLDICLAVSETLSHYYHSPISLLLKQKVSRGELGKKSGCGFYEYKNGRIAKIVISAGNKDTVVSLSDIKDRLLLRLLNEAVACYREKIVEDADLLDAGMIFGTGFPPFTGGPMNYIKAQGTAILLEKLKLFNHEYGERFKPDEGWDLLI